MGGLGAPTAHFWSRPTWSQAPVDRAMGGLGTPTAPFCYRRRLQAGCLHVPRGFAAVAPSPRRSRHLQLSPAGITAFLGAIAVCARQSNSRPEQLPKAIRQRMVNRSKPFSRASAGKSGSKVSPILIYPVSPSFGNTAGRSNRASSFRYRIKQSRSGAELLRHVKEACSSGLAEPSVFGAAMQVCGYRRWWSNLMEVRVLQEQARIQLVPIQMSIYLTALARSAFADKFGIDPERQHQIVRLGQQAWGEVDPISDVLNFNVGLGAALQVCAVACNAEGLSWAKHLWRWALAQEFEMGGLQYATYARVLETYQQRQEVDEMIDTAARAGEVWVSDVLLGSMVNAAAERKDWQRADEVWQRLVKGHGVEPTIIQYNAMAKAHMLCGRVFAALKVWGEADEEALNRNQKSVVDRAQLLLLVYHASPSEQNLHRLRRALDFGEGAIKDEKNARQIVDQWNSIKRAAQRLMQGDCESVRLRDVLIEWKARTKSALRQWPNHAGGSQYLGEAFAQ